LDSLLVRVARQDVEAFATLYDQIAPDVLRRALLVTHERGLAEDVTQEVFAWLWREAGQFEPARGSARGWIYTITNRRAVDAVRREDAWRKRSRPERADEHDHVIDSVLATESRRQLEEILTTCTTRQQEAIVLAYFGDHSYNHVAEQLEVSLAALKDRIHAGLTRMRRELLNHDSKDFSP